MTKFRGARLALAAIVGAGGLSLVTFIGVADAQSQPQGAPARQRGTQGQQQPRDAPTLGNVVDQLFTNTILLDTIATRGHLRQILQNRVQGPDQQPQIVIVNDDLDQTELRAMRDLIQNSQVLRRAVNTVQRVVRNDPQLQQFLQRNNIQPNQIVAIDLVGQPIRLFAFNQPITGQQGRMQPAPDGRQRGQGQPPQPGMGAPTGGSMTGGDMGGMGGMGGMGEALGGTAQTDVLGDVRLASVPRGPLAWVAHEPILPGTAEVTHRHAPGFVYAANGAHTVVIDGQERRLRRGESVFIGQDVEHIHRGGGFWDIRLTNPDAGPPPGMDNAQRVFASPPLQGIPTTPVQVQFIRVVLPPGGQTSVHTHPGPEYIYVTQGDIMYQNGLIGTVHTTAGEDHALPPDTPVQKRNPTGGQATFLSWFVVDPNQPFAPAASFAR